MLESAIPVKTAAGRQEIDERKHKLGPRHRMVLISINGERTVAGIRQQFAAINEIDHVLDELAAGGMIEVADDGELAIQAAAPIVAAKEEIRAAAGSTPGTEAGRKARRALGQRRRIAATRA